MDEIVVQSIQEYIDVVENLPDYCLSRGQTADRRLLPTALRYDDDDKRIYSRSKVNCFLEDYKRNSAIYMLQGREPQNEYEWMVDAQHFGVPTRLLDFTYSHIISLMFAMEKAFSEVDLDKKAVVWFLNPKKINMYSMNRMDIINISTFGDLKLDECEYPVVINCTKKNSRILAQNGAFVYFQHDTLALDEIDIAEGILKKVVIFYKDAKKILKNLYLLGLRFSSLYPELSSVSKDIILKNDVVEYMKEEQEDE